MHYDGTLRGRFSIKTPIMRDKKTGKSIEINKQMSPLDIQKLNKMYPCKTRKSTCGKLLTSLCYSSQNNFEVMTQTFLKFFSGCDICTRNLTEKEV